MCAQKVGFDMAQEEDFDPSDSDNGSVDADGGNGKFLVAVILGFVVAVSIAILLSVH